MNLKDLLETSSIAVCAGCDGRRRVACEVVIEDVSQSIRISARNKVLPQTVSAKPITQHVQTYLEPRERDHLTTSTLPTEPKGRRTRHLIHQVHPNRQINLDAHPGTLQHARRSNTRLLEDGRGLDRARGHDNFQGGIDGVQSV